MVTFKLSIAEISHPSASRKKDENDRDEESTGRMKKDRANSVKRHQQQKKHQKSKESTSLEVTYNDATTSKGLTLDSWQDRLDYHDWKEIFKKIFLEIERILNKAIFESHLENVLSYEK